MSRTAIYKSVYVAEVIGAVLLILWLAIHFRLSPLSIGALILGCFIPGRILGFYWRNLLRGLRLLREKQYVESKRHSELFLEEIRRRPWMKHLIWLASSSYSRDPEALALNNLAAAELKLGDRDAASEHFKASIQIDELNPLPYFNMAVLLSSGGCQEEAMLWFERAVERGYTGGITDAIVQSSQARFASVDGAGTAS